MKARIEFKMLLLVYKVLRYDEPTYLRIHLNKLRLDTNVTIRHTSDMHRLFEPRANCKRGERTFRYSAPRLYNKLPPEMKIIQDDGAFKKKLKTVLFARCYDLEDQKVKEDYKV